MERLNTASHTQWECKYHGVFIPKYRRKVLYGELRQYLGDVFRKLALQKEPPEGLDDAALERSVFAGRLKSDAIKAGAGMRTHPRRAAPARRDAGAGAVAEGISIPDGYGYPLSFARNGPIFRWRHGRRYVTPANHRCAFTRRCSLHALRHL
jgi:Transposase IS200 like